MKPLQGALAVLIGAALFGSSADAQPAGRRANLHELVSPLALYPNAEFQFQRSVAEQEAGGGEVVLLPLFRAVLRSDGSIGMTPSSVAAAPLFRYDDLQDRSSSVVEFTRQQAQALIDLSILPAARRVERLEPFSFDAVNVTVRDFELAAIEAPRWSPALGSAPVIVMKFGLNHSMQQHAHVALQFDRLLRLPNDATPEVVSASLSKFVNTYLAAYMSSRQGRYVRQGRADGRQFFDRGLLDAIHPVEWSTEDHQRYLSHVLNIFTVLLAHETCHHILGHTSSPAGDRRIQEMEADVCAADIFVEANAGGFADNEARLRFSVEAARYISLASMINWPAEATSGYPAPDERYRAIMASIPESLRRAEPELAEEIDRLLPFTAPQSVLENSNLAVPIIPRGQSGAVQRYDLLLDGFYPIREASELAGCGGHNNADQLTAFYCSRLEIDKAAILVEMIIMRGRAAIQDLAAIDRAIEIADRHLAEFNFPNLSSDLARLRVDVAAAERLPKFDGMAPRD